jgi:transketolase
MSAGERADAKEDPAMDGADAGLSWLPASEFRRVLDGISDPYDQARALSALSRINTLYMVMRAGSGHLGSSFSAADLVSWLYLREMRRPLELGGDIYFSSKGHDVPGLYATLIGLGALPEHMLHRLRRIGGLPGHPDVRTPHMPFNTGSLGMGISKAKGVLLGNRLLGRDQRVYVLTGDGELQEGQVWEALAGAARASLGELTAIVDHNKMQSDTWVRDVSDLGDLAAKFESFGWGVLRCDGHDHAQIEAAFLERATAFAGRPAVIIADTVKGAGCATFAATSMAAGEWRYRFHSGAPAEPDYATARGELLTATASILRRHGLASLDLNSEPVPRRARPSVPGLPVSYGQALTARAAADDRIVALDADLMVDTGLEPFASRFADRYFQCGIAEQDMVSLAGGLASRGLVPFVHSFSCFLHARPNEQIYNNATEGRRVVYVGSLAGLLPAGPGHSHQAVRDISALAAVPGLVMLEPLNAAEVEAAVDFCADTEHSVYLRLVSVPVPADVAELPAGPLMVGHGRVIREGGSAVAIGAGPVVLTELLRAAELLRADGIALTVVSLPWLNRVNPAWLADLAARAEDLFVVENHYTCGGQADMLARALVELDQRPVPRFLGLGLTGIPRCGNNDEALAAHGLSAARLAGTIRSGMRELPGSPASRRRLACPSPPRTG